MSLGLEAGIFAAYAAAMLAVYLTGRYLLVPVRWLGRIIVNSILGGLALVVINFLGSAGTGIFVPVNLITAGTVGVLGIPGMILLVLFFN